MLVFAHRGVSAHAPENTLKAIQLALDTGVDGIEIDVIQHQGEWLVLHDFWLDRTTNGTGHMEDYSLESLLSLNAGEGESIPTLSQVLARVGGQIPLNIELKGVSDIESLLPLLTQARDELGFQTQHLIVSSFNHLWLQQLRQCLPELVLGALMEGIPLECESLVEAFQPDYVCVSLSFVNKAFVEYIHSLKMRVLVYTVDRARDLKALAEMGVDGVFSNDPATARQHLQSLE